MPKESGVPMAGTTDSENAWEIEIDSFGSGCHLLKHPESGLGWFLASDDIPALLDKKPRFTILFELCKGMTIDHVREIAGASHTTRDLQTLLGRVKQGPAPSPPTH